MTPIFNIDDVQNYLEELAKLNTDLQHLVNGKRSFAKLNSNDHVNEIGKNPGYCVMILQEYGSRRIGDKEDYMLQHELVARIAVYASDGTEAAKSAATKKAEEIVIDIAKRLEWQQEKDFELDICGIMHHLQPEKYAWFEIEDQPYLVNHYGYDLHIYFKSYMPAYNAFKWLPPAVPGGGGGGGSTGVENFTDVNYVEGVLQFTGGNLYGSTEVDIDGFVVTLPAGVTEYEIDLEIGDHQVSWRKTPDGILTKTIVILPEGESLLMMAPVDLLNTTMGTFYEFPQLVIKEKIVDGRTILSNLGLAASAEEYIDIWNADIDNQVIGTITGYSVLTGIGYGFHFLPEAGQELPEKLRIYDGPEALFSEDISYFDMSLAHTFDIELHLELAKSFAVNWNYVEEELMMYAGTMVFKENGGIENFNYFRDETPTIRIFYQLSETMLTFKAGAISITGIVGKLPPALTDLLLKQVFDGPAYGSLEDLPELPASLINIDLYHCSLSVQDLNDLIDYLVASGQENGSLRINDQIPAAVHTNPDGYQTLRDRGWTMLGGPEWNIHEI